MGPGPKAHGRRDQVMEEEAEQLGPGVEPQLAAGAIALNGRVAGESGLAESDWRFGRFLLPRRGKKQYHLVRRP